jgi:hypothetical protein
MRVLRVQIVVLTGVFLLAAAVGVGIALADSGGEMSCCNSDISSDCSGCWQYGSYYIDWGSNQAYTCQGYVNPVGCSLSDLICATTKTRNVYTDSACANKIGTFDCQQSGDLCSYDGCN